MTLTRRKGLSGTQTLIIAALSVLACFCLLIVVAAIGMNAFPTTHSAASTSTSPAPLKPLSAVALNKTEIDYALQSIAPLASAPPQKPCDVPTSLQCFEFGYTSSEGDVFVLLLARFADPDAAVNFGIGVKVGKEQSEHAADVNIPTTVNNYRWLDLGFIGGAPMYYGGANEKKRCSSYRMGTHLNSRDPS